MEVDPFSIASAFLMHVGARHINFELTDAQKKLISHPISKIAVLFAMFYISTHSFVWSLLLILTYILIVNMLLNEKHPLNIFSKQWLHSQGLALTQNEFDTDTVKPIDLYRQNLNKL